MVANRAAGEVLSLDPRSGEAAVLADGFATPVGVVQTPDGSLIVSQYGGGVTHVAPDGTRTGLGAEFVTPGVGIVRGGDTAVFVVDYGGGTVRRVRRAGTSEVVVSGVAGNPVALARARNHVLVGTWGAGHVYRVPLMQNEDRTQ